jgi:Na+/H+ antiporter NhaC
MSVLELGYVPWSPIVWVIALAVVTAVAYFFRSRGQKKYKKDTAQTRIFLCGEEVPDAEARHIRAHNIYWGFFETLEGYYDRIIRPHTGILNDYIAWLVAVIAISTIILLIAGQF